jgi:hypothetical protein
VAREPERKKKTNLSQKRKRKQKANTVLLGGDNCGNRCIDRRSKIWQMRFGGLRDREIGFYENLKLMCIINKD